VFEVLVVLRLCNWREQACECTLVVWAVAGSVHPDGRKGLDDNCIIRNQN
jgi:hypothetical protein